jgi:hypothetical protein
LHQFHGRDSQAGAQQQPGRSWQLAQLQAGECKRAVGHKFALRDKYHPRHREYQHQGQGQQRVDRAIGQAVLDQKKGDLGVQVCSLVRNGEGRAGDKRRWPLRPRLVPHPASPPLLTPYY